jgi:formylglycine-generating enzyme required for sulfatase activity
LLDQVLAGLEAIHRRGIIHHDLKAANILIDREGTAYISDFGIAQFSGQAREATAMATAKYAAPEWIDPRLARSALEEQIDLYAAGMVAYEMLLGEARFHDAFPEVYRGANDTAAARWLAWHTDLSRAALNLNQIDGSIPAPLAGIVERLMAKDVNQRYRSASEARRDLDLWLDEAADSRGRRRDPRTDDQTMPLDRGRLGAAARSPVLPVPPPAQPAAPPAAALTPQAARRLPSWLVWAAGSAAFLAVVSVLLFVVLVKQPGFAVIIRGAPPGSDVYVDNVAHGTIRADGSIQVATLQAGKRLLRVAHEGYGDFNTAVSGKDGETKIVLAQCPPLDNRPAKLTEIDYNGPMALVPAGEYVMGDDTHQPNERPAHKVTLPDFYIDKLEVTNAQYKKFCDATGRAFPTNPWWDNQYFQNNPDSPVVGVNWHDASAYARWAGKRLPTEEEWEKAASWDRDAQKKRQWPWGDSPDLGRVRLGSSHSFAVGQQPTGQSAYGVQDMAGNVGEWVESYYQPYPGNQTADENYGTKNRLWRGGHFRSSIDDVRATARYYGPPEFTKEEKLDRSWLIGFRCAVSADDPRLQEFIRSRPASR